MLGGGPPVQGARVIYPFHLKPGALLYSGSLGPGLKRTFAGAVVSSPNSTNGAGAVVLEPLTRGVRG